MKNQEKKFGLNVDFVKKNDKQCFGKIVLSGMWRLPKEQDFNP